MYVHSKIIINPMKTILINLNPCQLWATPFITRATRVLAWLILTIDSFYAVPELQVQVPVDHDPMQIQPETEESTDFQIFVAIIPLDKLQIFTQDMG